MSHPPEQTTGGQSACGHTCKAAEANVCSASQVRYTLKNLVRDWAAEGAVERTQSYGWLLAALARHLPVGGTPPSAASGAAAEATEAEAPRVLVPGCGLGRLLAEAAARGYEAVGVEFSFFMLLALKCASRRGCCACCARQMCAMGFVAHGCHSSTCLQYKGARREALCAVDSTLPCTV